MNLKQKPIARGIQSVRADVTLAELARGVDTINRTFAEFRETNDQRLAALARTGSVDALVTQKLDAINATITAQQTALDETTRVLAAMRAGSMGDGSAADPAKAAYRSNFNSYFRRGENESQVREFNASATRGSNPDGGYLVTDVMESTIDRVLGTVSAMRAISNVVSITGSSYSMMVGQGGATSGWVGETSARSETTNPNLSKIEIPVHELYANPYATQSLLDDASVDIAAWLAGEVSIEFAEEEGAAFISGSGSARPRGILSYDTVANASWAWNKLGYIAGGKASTFDTDTGNNGTEKLVSLIHALKQGYRQNARWLMNTSTLETVRKFKDANNNYVWQPSIAAGTPSTLLGYEVTDDDNMPTIAANVFPVAFGDFQRGYQIVDRQGVRILRDPYSAKPYVSFYTTKRVGGGVRNFQAIKLLKIATS